MSNQTEVRFNRSSLFYWLTLCSFSVRTVTDTSKTTSYQSSTQFHKETTRTYKNPSLFRLKYQLLSLCFHNSLTDTRVKLGFSIWKTQLHTFVALLYFSFFFLSMIYQMLILMDQSFLKRQDFCNFILYGKLKRVNWNYFWNKVVLVFLFFPTLVI